MQAAHKSGDARQRMVALRLLAALLGGRDRPELLEAAPAAVAAAVPVMAASLVLDPASASAASKGKQKAVNGAAAAAAAPFDDPVAEQLYAMHALLLVILIPPPQVSQLSRELQVCDPLQGLVLILQSVHPSRSCIRKKRLPNRHQ